MHQETAYRTSRQDFYFSKATSFGNYHGAHGTQGADYDQIYDYPESMQRTSKEFTPSGKWEMNVSANPFELREPATQGFRASD